ncbi:hypothetical protein Fmac_010122 [Flemingia macrophylla]|uniref:Uncharacterized protein n=1 Tax=Flemingia macrophylla TaxID=520843 RepID=A0ABD1N322_9FABA
MRKEMQLLKLTVSVFVILTLINFMYSAEARELLDDDDDGSKHWERSFPSRTRIYFAMLPKGPVPPSGPSPNLKLLQP